MYVSSPNGYTYIKIQIYQPEKRGNMWCLSFWVSVTSLRMIVSSSIHLSVKLKKLFFSTPEWYFIVLISYDFIIHPSVPDGHLGCFHFLTILHMAAMNLDERIPGSCDIYISSLLRIVNSDFHSGYASVHSHQ